MSKVIVKIDSKVLDDLVRKECIALLNFVFNNLREVEDSGNPEYIYEIFKNSNRYNSNSQSKEKVND